MRLPARIALISLTLVGIVAQSPLVAAPASADQSVTGEWTEPFDIGTVAIHATLMPNGKVLIFQRPSLAYGSDARVWDPTTGELADVTSRPRATSSARTTAC